MSIEEIRGRLEAATPGPWEYEPSSGHVFAETMTDDGHEAIGVSFMENDEDGVLVAHAPEDMRRLLNALEAVQELTSSRAQQLRSTSDRLNQQVMSGDPDRDCSAAIRYDAYAAESETMTARVRDVITSALDPKS